MTRMRCAWQGSQQLKTRLVNKVADGAREDGMRCSVARWLSRNDVAATVEKEGRGPGVGCPCEVYGRVFGPVGKRVACYGR
jgi:hypothetical protein